MYSLKAAALPSAIAKRYEKWGSRHLPIKRWGELERLADLYARNGATLASVGTKRGISGEWVRRLLAERENALRCECRRLNEIDLGGLV